MKPALEPIDIAAHQREVAAIRRVVSFARQFQYAASVKALARMTIGRAAFIRSMPRYPWPDRVDA